MKNPSSERFFATKRHMRHKIRIVIPQDDGLVDFWISGLMGLSLKSKDAK